MKLTNYKGGGRNTIPQPGTELTDINSAADLQNLMRFYNIHGHGSMSENRERVFLVPENTWILFITPAGLAASKRKEQELADVLENFYYLKEGETIKQWNQRIYDSMKDGSLFQEILYKKDKLTEKFSIYEPGDVIQDLEVNFTNDSWPFVRLGIWSLPIPKYVKDNVETMNSVETIIKTDPELQAIFKKFETYQTEYPEYTFSVNLIVKYLKNMNSITLKSQKAFERDPAIVEALENTKLNQYYEEFMDILLTSIQRNKRMQDQLYTDSNNLVLYSPSTRENNFDSSLYSMLTENRLIEPSSSRTSYQSLLETPKYRFILVDACRSLDHPDKPEILYKERMALARSMSGIARRDVCVSNLLQLTKAKFQALTSGKTLPPTSAIQKLLEGQAVLLSDFEASVTGDKGSLRTLLEVQQFRKGNFVEVHPPSGNVYETVISNSGVNSTGKFLYKVVNPNTESNQEYLNVPATSVFPPGGRAKILKERASESARAQELQTQINTAIKAREKQEKNAKEAREAEAARKQAKANAEAARIKAEREKQQAAKEAANRATFEVPAHIEAIAKLPNKDLIKYRTRIKFQLPPLRAEPPATATEEEKEKWKKEKRIYDMYMKVKDQKGNITPREGHILAVRLVEAKDKNGNPITKPQVFVEGVFFGGEDREDRWWGTQFIVPASPAAKKGGRRKTRRSKKAKKHRKTRRH